MTQIDPIGAQNPDFSATSFGNRAAAAPAAHVRTPPAQAETDHPVTPVQAQEAGQQIQDHPEALREAVEQANRRLAQDFNTHMRFQVDDSTEKLVVQVIDGRTEEVVRQFPPEDVLNRLQAMEDLKGLVFEAVG
jgi:flagellar protein FlaG